MSNLTTRVLRARRRHVHQWTRESKAPKTRHFVSLLLRRKTPFNTASTIHISFLGLDIRYGRPVRASRKAAWRTCTGNRPRNSADVHRLSVKFFVRPRTCSSGFPNKLPRCSMSEAENPLSQRDQLALAVATGKSIALWARRNGVATRTAQRWAAEPDVRRLVEDSRRRILDRALGYMTGRSMWAVRGIAKLGEAAESESVQLRARRAILHDQIAVTKFSNFEHRMAELEEEVRVRNGNAAQPG
jgi:hypothetical protein